MTLDGKWTEILGQNVDWLVRKWKLFSSSMSSIQYSLITNWNSVRDLSWHKGLGSSSLWSHCVASGKVITVRELLWKARKELRGSQGKIWSCLSRIVLAGGTAVHWLLTHEVDLFHWRKSFSFHQYIACHLHLTFTETYVLSQTGTKYSY